MKRRPRKVISCLTVTFTLTVILIAACKRNKVTNIQQVPGVSGQHNSVVTQHNNNYRTGWNNNETQLTVNNVKPDSFGLVFSMNVDDQVYAQPLIVGNLSIQNASHNVVFVATVNNSVYAFDGDNGKLYWNKNYTRAGLRTVKNTDMTGACGGGYTNFSGNMGIVGTPVIDTVGKFIFFVTRSTDGRIYYQELHKVNLSDGSDVINPVLISATYQGTGDGSVSGQITFDPQKQNQRAALTLSNNKVIITWSSHCDWGPYHGWVIGYDASTLTQKFVFNTTPNDGDGGIWESGQGLSVDDQGNLLLAVGNSNNNLNDGVDFGESTIELNVNGNNPVVSSYFTPYNAQYLNQNDLDMGSLGSLLIPKTKYFFAGAKDGSLYLLDKDNMGGYNSASNNIVQQLNLNNSNANEHCQAAYYENTSGAFITLWSENDPLRTFQFNGSALAGPASANLSSGPVGQNGAMISVSSNGLNNAIIWATHAQPPGDAESSVSAGIVRAIDGSNINHELWNSNMISSDYVGKYAKFASPTIANGHVYVPTFSNAVKVYGLK